MSGAPNSANAVTSGLPPQSIPRDLPGFTTGTDLGPATPSPDHDAMMPYWRAARDLLVGLDAVKAGGEFYLPKHPKELNTDYMYRLNNGVLTNIFADIIETLAAKPFQTEVQIVDGSASVDFTGKPVMVPDPEDPSKKIDSGKRTGGLIEDIDGKGSHLHVFLESVFYNGTAAALDWIFVDYPDADPDMTAAQETAKNIKPYWYRIPADMVLDVQSDMVGGKEVFIYFRFSCNEIVKQGYSYVVKTRVREIIRPLISADGDPVDYGDPEWHLWEKDDTAAANLGRVATWEDEWDEIDWGTYTIGEIPVVPFVCGRRRGTTWVVDPPMKSAANLQIELYQQETGLKNITNLVCYPMLSANGVNLLDDTGEPVKVTIGPHTVLCAPPSPEGRSSGSWTFIEPNAESLKFCASRIDSTKSELRELGRQPLTAQSTNITVLTSAFASQKANSAVQSWAIRLKDAAENALLLTAKWMNETVEPEVMIDLDFTIDLEGDTDTSLLTMRAAGDLSQETLWEEKKRRGVLGPDFDPKVEKARLADETPSQAEVVAAMDPPTPDPYANPNNDPTKPGFDPTQEPNQPKQKPGQAAPIQKQPEIT